MREQNKKARDKINSNQFSSLKFLLQIPDFNQSVTATRHDLVTNRLEGDLEDVPLMRRHLAQIPAARILDFWIKDRRRNVVRHLRFRSRNIDVPNSKGRIARRRHDEIPLWQELGAVHGVDAVVADVLQRPRPVSRIPEQARAVHSSADEEAVVVPDVGGPDCRLVSPVNADSLFVCSSQIVGDQEVVVGAREGEVGRVARGGDGEDGCRVRDDFADGDSARNIPRADGVVHRAGHEQGRIGGELGAVHFVGVAVEDFDRLLELVVLSSGALVRLLGRPQIRLCVGASRDGEFVVWSDCTRQDDTVCDALVVTRDARRAHFPVSEGPVARAGKDFLSVAGEVDAVHEGVVGFDRRVQVDFESIIDRFCEFVQISSSVIFSFIVAQGVSVEIPRGVEIVIFIPVGVVIHVIERRWSMYVWFLNISSSGNAKMSASS